MIDKSQSAMADSNTTDNKQRRRSARLSSSPQDDANLKVKEKMALGPAVKRSITVRKIAPRKTAAPSEHDKENTPRRTERRWSQRKRQTVSTPGNEARSSSAKKKAAMPSPILPSTPPPPPPSHSQQPATQPVDPVWSQKVRRSYSRLSDPSLHSPDQREDLFGFERLKTPEVIGQTRTGHSFSGSLAGLSSFTLLEAEDCGSASPDTNIPGVAVTKERRRRRRKVQQIGESELDAMAAKMNAEFEEAEVFELVVE